MNSIISVLALAATALAASGHTSAFPECLTVGKGGGKYSTIQSAVDSLKASAASSSPQCLFIQPGTYDEQVYVDSTKGPVSFYGYTHDASSYRGNQVTITGRKSQAEGLSDDDTAVVRIRAANFKMYNINVQNTHGPGSQAVALSARECFVSGPPSPLPPWRCIGKLRLGREDAGVPRIPDHPRVY